jgi:hypothetical protein
MKSLGAVAVVVACVLAGCASAPLGKTSYPPAPVDDLEGTWQLRPPAKYAEQTGVAQRRVTMSVHRSDAAAAEVPGAKTGRRYTLSITSEGPEERDRWGPVELEGEFVKTAHWTLFTYQRSARQHDWTAGLSLPVQQTVRVQRAGGSGDQLMIDAPKMMLVYVPMRMAGELKFEAPGLEAGQESAMALVQNVDDIFATLDRAGPEAWEPVGTAVRVSR